MRVKTETKRREILAAAAAEFGRRGYHETTLGHVAAHMGSSKATIYNYFPTKAELFGAMLAAAARPANDTLLATLSPDRDPAAALADFARAYVRMHTGARAVAVQRLIVAEHDRMDATIDQLRADPDGWLWPRVERVLGGWQERGLLVAGDSEAMARSLFAVLHGDLPLRLLLGERDAFDDAERDTSADRGVAMFLAAYLPR